MAILMIFYYLERQASCLEMLLRTTFNNSHQDTVNALLYANYALL